MQIVQKAAIKAGEKYLILYRSKKEEIKPGCWDFPGGRLQDGEDPEAGLMREVKEETGLKIKVLERRANYQIGINGVMYYFVVYTVKVVSDNQVILSPEHTEYTWAAPAEIKKLQMNDFLELYINEITK